MALVLCEACGTDITDSGDHHSYACRSCGGELCLVCGAKSRDDYGSINIDRHSALNKCHGCPKEGPLYNVFSRATGAYVNTARYTQKCHTRYLYEEINEPTCPPELIPDGDYIVQFKDEDYPIFRRKIGESSYIILGEGKTEFVGLWKYHKIIGKATIEWAG